MKTFKEFLVESAGSVDALLKKSKIKLKDGGYYPNEKDSRRIFDLITDLKAGGFVAKNDGYETTYTKGKQSITIHARFGSKGLPAIIRSSL